MEHQDIHPDEFRRGIAQLFFRSMICFENRPGLIQYKYQLVYPIKKRLPVIF